MIRRRAITATVGLAAVVAGAGWAWWRQREPALPGVKPGVDERFWRLRFEQPDGTVLSANTLRGRPLLLNFWATWCPPCIEEMPLLDRFGKAQPADGWQVLGLAIDRPQPVQDFLAKRPMGFAIALAGAQGLDLTRSLGNTSGALPFSAAFDREGRLAKTHLGPFTATDLADWTRLSG